jgi:hypothetical protein
MPLFLPIIAVLGSMILGACAGSPQSAATSIPTAGAQSESPQPGMSPTPAPPTIPLAPTSLARGYLTTPAEQERAARLAEQGVEPYKTAVEEVLKSADAMLAAKRPRLPDEIDIKGDDIEKPAYLSDGSKAAYAWALAYNLLKDRRPSQAQQFAEAAYELIMAMPWNDLQVSGYQANTRLNISAYIQNFIYAADLLADWTAPNGNEPFGRSDDARALKRWLGAVIIRYPYNVAHLRVNNWGAWGRLTTAVIADYVGDEAPLYVQGIVQEESGAYQVDPNVPCEAGDTATCAQVDAGTIYATALRLHLAMVDGKLYEPGLQTCDGSGSKSMIRPDGGLPDELRRQYDCDTTEIDEPYGAAARYSQFALGAMVSLAELAWRRGDAGLYTHIDPATGRGALYRAVQFLLANNVTWNHASILELVNRFYSYRAGVEPSAERRQAYQELLRKDLPGILKRQGKWPAGVQFVSFGTLTHGFALDEELRPPPSVPARG